MQQCSPAGRSLNLTFFVTVLGNAMIHSAFTSLHQKREGDPCSRTGDDIRERPRPAWMSRRGFCLEKVSVALSDGSGVHQQKA
jgi:hypothetical protein